MKFESPIERIFYETWLNAGGKKYLDLTYQYVWNKYRFDFADINAKVVIELDGFKYHTTQYQFTEDRKRERYLEFSGWRVIRFSGSEINKNPQLCLKETKRYITMVNNTRKN